MDWIRSLTDGRVPHLRVHHLLEANRFLKQIRKKQHAVLFKKPWYEVQSMEVVTFSDASFNTNERQIYGQTGVISGIRFRGTSEARCFHAVEWTNHKQRRVSHSSFDAEILAAAQGDDCGFAIKQAMATITRMETRSTLLVDSESIFDTLTTLHEGNEYRLRQTVQQLRDSFESKEFDRIRWIQGKVNLADALTKMKNDTQELLKTTLSSGKLNLPPHNAPELDSRYWT